MGRGLVDLPREGEPLRVAMCTRGWRRMSECAAYDALLVHGQCKSGKKQVKDVGPAQWQVGCGVTVDD
jgi:hypothetical protein